MIPSSKPVVFVDRDGTLMEEVGFCGDPRDVRLIPGASEALERLRAAGFGIVIVTNQSGIGRGYYSERDFHAVQAELFRQLGHGLIDATYFCPDHPDVQPSRRKPAPDMLLDAARDLGYDLSRSYMVGDRKGDVDAGRNAGCRGSVLVLSGEARDASGIAADLVAATIADAADWILAHARIAESGVVAGTGVESLRRLGEGEDSVAWLLNNRLVCRVPKNEQARQCLIREASVLPRIAGSLPIDGPPVAYRTEHGFSVHERLHGEPLTLEVLAALTAGERERCLSQLGEFLQAVHSYRDPLAFPELQVADYRMRYADTAARAGELLLAQAPLEVRREILDALHAWQEYGFADQPSLLHGDLHPDHILWDPEARRIAGVIDFADIEFGDPAWDFARLGEDFPDAVAVQILRAAGYRDEEEMLRRAQLLQAIERIESEIRRTGGR